MSEYVFPDDPGAGIVTCAECQRTTVLEPGAPGPVGWIDLTVWNGEMAAAIGYYCSVECPDEGMAAIVTNYGDTLGREPERSARRSLPPLAVDRGR